VAAFSAAGLYLLGQGKTFVEFLKLVEASPEGRVLFAVTLGLTVVSALIAAWLFVVGRVNLVVLAISVMIVPAAFAWNSAAPAFWILPLPFVWASFRTRTQ